MTPEQFAYWMHGFVELNGGAMPSDAQWKSIQQHLATVFQKVTPHVETEKATESDAQKSMREYMERMQRQVQQTGQIVQPYQPYYPPQNWPSTILPGTVIC